MLGPEAAVWAMAVAGRAARTPTGRSLLIRDIRSFLPYLLTESSYEKRGFDAPVPGRVTAYQACAGAA